MIHHHQVIRADRGGPSPVELPVTGGDRDLCLPILRLEEAIAQCEPAPSSSEGGVLLCLQCLIEIVPQAACDPDQVGVSKRIQAASLSVSVTARGRDARQRQADGFVVPDRAAC